MVPLMVGFWVFFFFGGGGRVRRQCREFQRGWSKTFAGSSIYDVGMSDSIVTTRRLQKAPSGLGKVDFWI